MALTDKNRIVREEVWSVGVSRCCVLCVCVCAGQVRSGGTSRVVLYNGRSPGGDLKEKFHFLIYSLILLSTSPCCCLPFPHKHTHPYRVPFITCLLTHTCVWLLKWAHTSRHYQNLIQNFPQIAYKFAMDNIAYLFVIIILSSTFLVNNSLLLRSYQFNVNVNNIMVFLSIFF